MSDGHSKRERNQRERAIDPAECEALFDSLMLTREDKQKERGDRRLISLAWLKGRVVVLVWINWDTGPQVISCRRSEPHEQEAYLRALPQA